MATPSSISVTEGIGKNIATHSISESTTKELQRVEINNSSGVELGVAAAPLQVSLANTASNSTAVKVDPSAVTSPVSLAALPALVAGTALVGTISASNETSTVYTGTTALTPKFATIATSSSGATTIVALVSSKKIRVLAMNLVANAAVNVKWQSHVTPTDKTGLAYLAANGGYILPFSPVGWFETIAGEALDINLSGSVAVGGHLTYIEV